MLDIFSSSMRMHSPCRPGYRAKGTARPDGPERAAIPAAPGNLIFRGTPGVPPKNVWSDYFVINAHFHARTIPGTSLSAILARAGLHRADQNLGGQTVADDQVRSTHTQTARAARRGNDFQLGSRGQAQCVEPGPRSTTLRQILDADPRALWKPAQRLTLLL